VTGVAVAAGLFLAGGIGPGLAGLLLTVFAVGGAAWFSLTKGRYPARL
jgi:hypothetical protein